MTFIPGTTPPKNEVIQEEEKVSQKPMVLNVDEMIEAKKVKDPEETIWYLKLKYWLLFGLAISSVFILFGLLDNKFLVFAPLWPFATVVSWFVRKAFVKIEGKNKLKS